MFGQSANVSEGVILVKFVSRMVPVDGSMTEEFRLSALKHSLSAYKRPVCMCGLGEGSKVTSLCDLRGCKMKPWCLFLSEGKVELVDIITQQKEEKQTPRRLIYYTLNVNRVHIGPFAKRSRCPPDD